MQLLICFIFLLQIAFTSLVYPALILGYMGQAAYLSKHHNLSTVYRIGFYATVPGIWRSRVSHVVLKRSNILIRYHHIICS